MYWPPHTILSCNNYEWCFRPPPRWGPGSDFSFKVMVYEESEDSTRINCNDAIVSGWLPKFDIQLLRKGQKARISTTRTACGCSEGSKPNFSSKKIHSDRILHFRYMVLSRIHFMSYHFLIVIVFSSKHDVLCIGKMLDWQISGFSGFWGPLFKIQDFCRVFRDG